VIRGAEPAELLHRAHQTSLCNSHALFEAALQIGSGRNGTVYMLRSTLARRYFACSYSVVLKEIRSKGLLAHLHRPCLRADGNLICASQVASEALNGALATELHDSGITPHFVRQLCFFSCEERCYLVYEFCGYRLRNQTYRSITLYQLPRVLRSPPSEQVVMELLFAILHSLWVAQRCYGQVHYDLKPDNIFIQPITSVSEFAGVRLSNIQYFGYCLGDAAGQRYCYYMPNRGYLVKLGDYGTAVSTRVKRDDGREIAVMPAAVWNGNERLRSAFGISREFQPGYDAHFFLPQLVKLCATWGVAAPEALLRLVRDNGCHVQEKTCRPSEPVLAKTPCQLIMETDWSEHLRSGIGPQQSSVLIGRCLWQV
jgi:serine/threonine protein kinase